MRLLICGGNGAGKTTLGRALAQAAGWVFRDAEDYYFPGHVPGTPYPEGNGETVVAEMLLADLRRHPHFIYDGVKADYGRADIVQLFDLAVYLDTPKDVRMARVRQRDIARYGVQAESLQRPFWDLVQSRPQDAALRWLAGTGLPVLRLDGSRPTEELVDLLKEKIGW